MIKPRSRFNSAHLPVKPAPNAGLTLFVDATSLASLWPQLVLAEKDIDSARVETVRRERPHEDFLVLNPHGILPALSDREGVITGARVIAEYLNERYPHPPLMPLGPALRARTRMRIQNLEDQVFPALTATTAGRALSVAARNALTDAFRQFSDRPAESSTDIEHDLADCAWTAMFWHLRQIGVALPTQVRGLREWAELLLARPAVKRAWNR